MDKTIVNWIFNRYKDERAIVRQLREGITAKIFVGTNSMLSFVQLDPFSEGESHQHPEEQWGILLEGKCTRTQDGQEFEMQMGDFWITPSNVQHSLRTSEMSAVILDVFSPPRPEYCSDGKGFGNIEKSEAPTKLGNL